MIAPEKLWRVLVASDYGEGAEPARYRLYGENLYRERDCLDRRFTWYTDTLDHDERYDFAFIVWDNPTAKFRQLLPGERFRHPGILGASYVVSPGDDGDYKDADGYGWKASPDMPVVRLPRVGEKPLSTVRNPLTSVREALALALAVVDEAME